MEWIFNNGYIFGKEALFVAFLIVMIAIIITTFILAIEELKKKNANK